MPIKPAAGYLALPTAGHGPGVLVLHAWWGINETIRTYCQMLANDGFVAFAPDLYHGQLAKTIPAAEALANGLDEARAKAETAAAAAFLSRQAGGPIGVIGFSLGGYYALQLSGSAPDLVNRVALYYGAGDGDFDSARAAYLCHFAADDPYEPEENVGWLTDALQKAHRPVTIHRYPGTGHWFAEPDRPAAYHPQAAELAWERTLAFLQGADEAQVTDES